METTNVQHESVSVGEWVLTIIISAIPLVNIVMLLVWAFSSGTNPSKANWAKAYLIFMAILIALYFVMAVMVGVDSTPQNF